MYLIAKPYHLAWFRDYVNGTIVNEGEVAGTTHPSASAMLTADIDLKNYCHAAEDGKELLSWIPIGNYYNRWKGNMNGQGHTISNLYIKTAQNYVGLFGYTKRATIQDLIFDYAKVENVNTTNTNTLYTGILAGYADGVSPSHIRGIKTTNNCTVIGQEDTGGIVGGARINLENCENHSSVKGTRSVGGIAGSSSGIIIKRCTNYGTVENNNSYIGGIIGYAYKTSIEDCANYGKITSTGWNAGGIAGQTFGNSRIQNVFSYGDVTNTNDNPGIIIGYVRGTTAKGIVAYNKEALLNNSFVDINNIVGTGTLTFEDGKVEADVVKAFTKQQIKSGEVAYLLAEGKVLGEQAWGQQLGKDQYPVPGSDNKVIKAAQGDKDANGNDTYWATFSNPTNDVTLSVPSDRTLKVYNATVSGGKMTLTERDSQVAKEEGVLLKTDGEYVNAKANETNELTKVSSDDNHLVATPAEAKTVTAETGCKLYRLTYNKATAKERLGFYLSNDGISLKATPGKAYLQVSENEAKDPSSAALARSFVFGGGNETTGIDGITIMGTDVQRHGTIEGIFDLQGRKISNPTKGIYIKNNKKVVIK